MQGLNQRDLKELIGSCKSLMYVVGKESENVVVEYIKEQVLGIKINIENEIANKFRCYEWSRTTGIRSLDDGEDIGDPKDTQDANAMLDEVMKMKQSSVIIAKHLHYEFKNGGNPHILRKLQDFVNNSYQEERDEGTGRIINAAARIIIIVSPVMEIPPELESVITVVDFELADAEKVALKINGRVDELEKSKKIDFGEEKRNQLVKAAQGLSDLDIEDGLSFSMAKEKTFNPIILNNLKSQIVRKNGEIDCINDTESAEDLGGFDRFKTWIQERKAGFTVEGQAYGLAIPKGVLLIGLQGSGKTMCAKVISQMFNMPLYKLDLGKMFSSLVGQSEQKTRDVLKTLEAVAPCVVLFDEIEKGLAGLESSGKSDAGTTSRVIGTILQWLNDKKAPVFVVATSNNIRSMPPELLRAGRFDGVWFVALPSKEERRQIFEIHLKKVRRDFKKFDLDVLAKATENFSGAEIEQVIKNALYRGYNAKAKDIDTDFILEASKDIVPLYITAKESLKEIYEWVGFDKTKQDGIRARFVSSKGVNKYEEDRKRIGFTNSRIGFVDSTVEVKKDDK